MGDYSVIPGKNRNPPSSRKNSATAASSSSQNHSTSGGEGSGIAAQAQWNVIPPLKRGINRGQASIRRTPAQNQALREARQRPQQQQPQVPEQPRASINQDAEEEQGASESMDLSVEPVQGTSGGSGSSREDAPTYKSSVVMLVNKVRRKV